jgi:hypothetical protein
LDLLFLPGTKTQEKNNKYSILDLVLYIPDLINKVIVYQVIDNFYSSDYLPIESIIETDRYLVVEIQLQKCWKRIDCRAIQAGVQ